MADSSSQAAGSSDAPGPSHGHKAASHNEAYGYTLDNQPDPLAAGGDGALPFNFSQPEPGFNPDDHSAVTAFYRYEEGARHVLDLQGQPGPTVEEQIENQAAALGKQLGRDVSGEEREAIETTLRRNNGWLEAYKAGIGGAQTVPIEAFNRLAHDYEQQIMFMARDRANYEADYIKELKEQEDLVRRLREDGEVEEQGAQHDPDSNEFRLQLYKLRQDVANRDRQLYLLKKKGRVMLQEAEAKVPEEVSSRVDRLERDIADRDREISELQKNAKEAAEAKAQADSEVVFQLRWTLTERNAEIEQLKENVKAEAEKARAQPDVSGEVARLERAVADRDLEIERLKEDVKAEAEKAKAKPDLSGEVTRLQRMLRVVEESEKSQDVELQNARKNYDTLKRENQRLTQDNQGLAQENQGLAQQLSTSNRAVEKGKAQLAQLSARVARQEGDLNDLAAAGNVKQSEIGRLQKELSTIHQSDQQGQSRIDGLERELSAVRKSDQQGQNTIRDLRREAEALNASDRERQAENSALTEQLTTALDILKEQQSFMVEVQQKNEELRSIQQ